MRKDEESGDAGRMFKLSASVNDAVAVSSSTTARIEWIPNPAIESNKPIAIDKDMLASFLLFLRPLLLWRLVSRRIGAL